MKTLYQSAATLRILILLLILSARLSILRLQSIHKNGRGDLAPRVLTLLLTLFARLSILRLLTSLLQTTRVAQRHKVQRMHLQDAKYLGLMHLRIKRFEQVLHYFHIQNDNLTVAFKEAATKNM